MRINTLGVVGAKGSFGAVVCDLTAEHAPWVRVIRHDKNQTPDGQHWFQLCDAAQCDAVVFAVPIESVETAVQNALKHLRDDTVVVTVSTVKMNDTEVINRLVPHHRCVITHPPFGPETLKAYGGSVQGFRVVVTKRTISDEDFVALRVFAEQLGLIIVDDKSDDEHDRLMSRTQYVTYLFRSFIEHLNLTRTDMDTVTFADFMTVLDRVKHDSHLFRAAARANPHCVDVIDQMIAMLQLLRSDAKKPLSSPFENLNGYES
jgi:prephenate dehydrogenase